MTYMETYLQIASITYKQFNKINFPIFPLDTSDIYSEDGLVISNQTELVIDDLNQLGLTLGLRRLATPHELHPLKRYCGDAIDFFHTNAKMYIDNYGFMFMYERTEFTEVKFYKILKVIDRDTLSLLKVESIPFLVPVARPTNKKWVGMLFLKGHPWLPYEYSDIRCKNLKRKI